MSRSSSSSIGSFNSTGYLTIDSSSSNTSCPPGYIKFFNLNTGKSLILTLIVLILIFALLVTNCILYNNKNGEESAISPGWATFAIIINVIAAIVILGIIFWVLFKLGKNYKSK
jgi:putative copper export protein